jgi:hypothetical protein
MDSSRRKITSKQRTCELVPEWDQINENPNPVNDRISTCEMPHQSFSLKAKSLEKEKQTEEFLQIDERWAFC